MKATALIRKQHRNIDALLRTLARGGTLDDLRRLADVLAAHALMEEESVYPVVRERREDVILKALESHAVARHELERLMRGLPGEPAFHARARTLRALVKQHAGEEEAVLLPRLEKALQRQEQTALGTLLEKRFQELVAVGHDEVLARLATLDAEEEPIELEPLEDDDDEDGELLIEHAPPEWRASQA